MKGTRVMRDWRAKLCAAILLMGSIASAQEKAPDITPAIPPNISAKPADRFPEAEGKENVTAVCSACHTLVRVAANRRSAKAWSATLKIHQQQRGLKLEPEEIPPIVNYLAAWFGTMVNINTASVEELSDLPQVNKKLAEAIVSYRARKGTFKSVDDLGLVEGFPPDLLPKLKQRVETGAKQ